MRGMIWENGIETCILSYMKRITSPDLMNDTGCLGLVPWDDPEGWVGEGEKVGLTLNIQKTKIMASGPITSWEIGGETVETVSNFIFGGSKITADGDCSHEIKRCLLLGIKVMTNLDSIFKSRDITLPTKVRLVKAMIFPVVMYGCESWTVKKAECQRIDAFDVVLEKTLESPLDCKEIQSVHSETDQPWDFFGRNDAKAEAPVLWPPHAKS